MDLKQMKSKRKKLLKLHHELKNIDFSEVIGKKVTLTKSCVDWHKKHADLIGMPYNEMEIIISNPIGTIAKARYDEDGFTFTVEFDNLTIRLGVEDIVEKPNVT